MAAGTPITPKGWGAGDLESAYKLPVTGDPDQTVAVVDAYRTPNLANSLATYRTEYGLPACPTSTGCLRIVNQSGAATPLPGSAVPFGWDIETTLDAEMVSAACPLCKILVVEARSPKLADLAAAENTAARLGAQVISDSFGTAESGPSQTYAKAYDHPGHVIVAASGDDGFTAANFPADQPAVTAAGGTELAKSTSQRGWTEQAWRQSGSACSAWVPKPKWQHDRHCALRTIADVSAAAANLAVYDQARRGWLLVSGTSAAAPLIAGIYAPGRQRHHHHLRLRIPPRQLAVRRDAGQQRLRERHQRRHLRTRLPVRGRQRLRRSHWPRHSEWYRCLLAVFFGCETHCAGSGPGHPELLASGLQNPCSG